MHAPASLFSRSLLLTKSSHFIRSLFHSSLALWSFSGVKSCLLFSPSPWSVNLCVEIHRMEHLDHENLSLCVLSTFSTYYERTCLLLLLVLLSVFKWHCVGGVLVILWYPIAKYDFGLFDKQWYNCFPIYLIAYNIPPVFSIIAWDLIRKHHLVYNDRKYVSHLSLLVKVFRYNLYQTKFKHLLLLIHF